jgi:hypothetical protein
VSPPLLITAATVVGAVVFGLALVTLQAVRGVSLKRIYKGANEARRKREAEERDEDDSE